MTVSILGGIGLFLLGMALMTDALKALAGDALRLILSRFVSGPWSAMLSGATATLLMQSSTATTLTTIGFVSAGLITFPQSIGVIFGANIGTTSTGWMVSLLGLQFSIAIVAMPAVAVGAVLRLLGRDRVAAAGLAVAGFGLIFVGIDTLQVGMAGLAERFDLSGLTSETLGARALLVVIGFVMTVIMQSSSAAVATTLTALHAGAVSMPQAAALVIGQNIGTTATAVIAAFGASVAARRTALVHVLFNVITGMVVFGFLPMFVRLAEFASQMVEPASPAVGIAAFHTGFSVLGIALLVPVMSRLSVLVERLVPERGPDLSRRLDSSVANLTPVAIEAARLTLLEIMRTLAGALYDSLRDRPSPRTRGAVVAAARALETTSAFLAQIRTGPESSSEHERHVAVLSAFDHLSRLRAAAGEAATIAAARDLAVVETPRRHLLELLALLRDWPDETNAEAALPRLAEVYRYLEMARRDMREVVLRDTADGRLDPYDASRWLDAMMWMEGVAYHLWHGSARLCFQRAEDREPAPTAEHAHPTAAIANV